MDCNAVVCKNGVRRTDRENVPVFSNEPVGIEYIDSSHCGVLGSGNVRVVCDCDGFPRIVKTDGSSYNIYNVSDIVRNPSLDKSGMLSFMFCDCNIIYIEDIYTEWCQYSIEMVEPDGTEWTCVYGWDKDYKFTVDIVKNDDGTYSSRFFIPCYSEKSSGMKTEKEARMNAYLWCCECAQSFLNTADRILETIDGI